MKYLADENFPFPSVILLRSAGHDVRCIIEFAGGAGDQEVARIANEDLRTILTFDSDLGTLAVNQGQAVVGGIVYFRLFNYKPDMPWRMLLDYLTANPEVDLSGCITVFDPPRVRQRRM
jgi:predicted nuclease of predicted toxin-antitoxin system